MSKAPGKFSTVDGAGVLACVVITVIAYFAAVRPLLEQHTRTAAMQQALTVQRQRAAAATNMLRSAEKDLTNLQAAIAKRPLKIAPQNLLNQRLSELTKIAAGCELTIQTLQPGVATAGAKYNTVPILLSGRGSYVDCVRYLTQLHRDCLDVAVTSLKMQGNPESATATSTFEFNLVWFALPSSPTQTAAAQ